MKKQAQNNNSTSFICGALTEILLHFSDSDVRNIKWFLMQGIANIQEKREEQNLVGR
jgi:hypothetical protein